MLETTLAQRLLCLFTARDRAESIVGDLLEESGGRGHGWFVSQTLRIALALCLENVGAIPLRSVWLASVTLVSWLGIYVALAVITGLFGFLRYFDIADLDWSLHAAPLGFWARVFTVVIATNFLTGLLITRLTGSAPLVVLWLASWVAWPFLAQFFYALSWYWVVGGALVFPFVYLIPLLAGSALALRRTA